MRLRVTDHPEPKDALPAALLAHLRLRGNHGPADNLYGAAVALKVA